MFRIASSGIVARRLLFRRPHLDIQCATFTRTLPTHNKNYPPQERDPCPQPPPEVPPPKNDAWIWGTLTLVALGAGFAVYAKTNPEVRDWLSIKAPWMDDLIAVMYQENMTYQEFAHECAKTAKLAIANFFKEEPRKCTDDGRPIKVVEIVEETPECTDVEKEGDYVIVNSSDDEDDDEEECVKVVHPILTKDICEVESCLKDLGDDALFNYITARDACIYYNKLVEDTMINFSMRRLKELHEATEERKELVSMHVGQAQCTVARLDELSRFFECGVQAPKDAVKNTKDLLKEYQSKIKTVRTQWQWENDRSIALDNEWTMVEELLDKYATENTMMSKDLDYLSEKPSLKGDPDLLLHHTLRYAELLKDRLCDALEGMTERVNRAYDTLIMSTPEGNPVDEKKKKELDNNLAAARKKKWADIENDFYKRASDQKAENYRREKDTLKKHAEHSQKILELRLEQKAVEANKKLDKMVADQVALERKKMADDKRNMAFKLKVVEDKLEAHLKAERETRRSQDLWVAGYSLLAATKKGESYVNVDKEIKAIERASGNGDKLVLSVLKAIPESVKKKGVVPESVIKDNYHVMEDVAMKVALVEQEGAPLPVFILSFIQSLFLFMKISGIPQNEYDNPPNKPPEDLDTFDLLQRARFWIERGDIASALKYVGALEGASRAAAETWHEAARSHLETRQAAEAVLAHATALGLQYV